VVRSDLLPAARLGECGSDGLPIFEEDEDQQSDYVDDACADAVPTFRDQDAAEVASNGPVEEGLIETH
jgi:hypothetical protein